MKKRKILKCQCVEAIMLWLAKIPSQCTRETGVGHLIDLFSQFIPSQDSDSNNGPLHPSSKIQLWSDHPAKKAIMCCQPGRRLDKFWGDQLLLFILPGNDLFDMFLQTRLDNIY